MLSNKFKNWIQASVRVLLIATACCILVFSNVFPAQAATSQATEGEANLNTIQKKTDDVARSNPRGLKETTKAAQGGLNAVQGAADKDKMIDEDNTQATSFEEQVKSFFEDKTN
jgi:hypothetical protein